LYPESRVLDEDCESLRDSSFDVLSLGKLLRPNLIEAVDSIAQGYEMQTKRLLSFAEQNFSAILSKNGGGSEVSSKH
jgi:hypothetical protein